MQFKHWLGGRNRLGQNRPAMMRWLAVLLIAVMTAAEASANPNVMQARIDTSGTISWPPLVPTVAGDDCTACHVSSGGPANAASFKVKFFSELFVSGRSLPTPAAYVAEIKKIAQDNFAPSLSGMTNPAPLSKPAAVNIPIIATGGRTISTGSDANLAVSIVTVSAPDPGFTIGGSGRTLSLQLAAGALKNRFGTINVTIEAQTVEGMACDSSTSCRKTLTLTLNNAAPAIATSSFVINGSGDPVNGSLTATDPDGDDTNFSYAAVTPPVKGTLTAFNAATGAFTYTPSGVFTTPFKDTFEVTVADQGGATSAATKITITSGANNAPVPVNVTTPVTLAEDTTANLTVPAAADADVSDILQYSAGACTNPGNTLAKTPGTAATARKFTYRPALDFNGSDSCKYAVNDGTVSVEATIAFSITPVNDPPVVVMPVKEVNFNVVTDQRVDTPIDLKLLVSDKETPVANLTYTVIDFQDFGTGNSELPSRYGSFLPVKAVGDEVPGGAFTFKNRPNVALEFVIIYQVSETGLPAVPCSARPESCGRVRISMTLNGEGRHDPGDIVNLTAQLGGLYKTIPGGVGHFPSGNVNAACLNCHMPSNVTVTAPNCQAGKGFFNAFGRRLCKIRPFQKDADGTFTSRVRDAIEGKILNLPSFEPALTAGPVSISIKETANQLVVDSSLKATTGYDLLGDASQRDKKAHIKTAYLRPVEANKFFQVNFAADGSHGEIKLVKPLSGWTGADSFLLEVLPVNDGGPKIPGVSTGDPGFYPVIVGTPSSRLIRIDIERERPIGKDDKAQVSFGDEIDIDVLANDTLGGSVSGIQKLSDPARGTLTISGQKFHYAADGSKDSDTVSFEYRAFRKLSTGKKLFSEPVTVTIVILPANVPVAQNDGPLHAAVGETLMIDALANDQGASPAVFRILTPQPSTFGRATIEGKKIRYEPIAAGTDRFEYRIANAQGRGTTATVTVIVGNISGNALAAATADKTLKPVARALGDTCQALQAKDGSASADQRKLIKLCRDMLDENAQGGSIDSALEQIRNEETLAAGDAVQQHERASAANILGRLDNVRGGQGRGLNFSQLSLQIDDNSISGALIDATLDKSASDRFAAPKADLPWGVFVAGNVSVASQDTSDREAGFDLSGVMLTAGLDYALNERALIGLAISGGQSITDIGASDTLATRSIQLAGYGSFNIAKGLYVDGYGGVASNSFDMDRNVAFSLGQKDYNNTAAGAFDGESISAALRLKYEMPIGSALLSTYGTLSYVAAWTNSYVEKGAGIYSMSVGEQNFDTLTATIGTRLTGELQYDFGTLKPYVGVSYAKQLDSDRRSVRSSWAVAGNSGSSFVLTTENGGDNFGGFEIGFTADLAEGASVETGLSGTLSDGGFEEYMIRAALNIPLGAPPPPPEQVAPTTPVATAPKKPAAAPVTNQEVPPTGGSDGGSGGGGSSGGGGWQ